VAASIVGVVGWLGASEASHWRTGRVTSAVLARKIDSDCPTVLLDEWDATARGNQELTEGRSAAFSIPGTSVMERCQYEGPRAVDKNLNDPVLAWILKLRRTLDELKSFDIPKNSRESDSEKWWWAVLNLVSHRKHCHDGWDGSLSV
jgi:hypothetical protein